MEAGDTLLSLLSLLSAQETQRLGGKATGEPKEAMRANSRALTTTVQLSRALTPQWWS